MVRNRKGRIAVAMSGGVDSSMAAALLVEEGYEVIGLTMVLSSPEASGAPSPASGAPGGGMASRVAAHLGIQHYWIHLHQAFQREIVDHFVTEYQKGRTPSPCLRCNERIKFGRLLEKAEELGAAALATGHYARTLWDRGSDRYLLLRGIDPGKDQSYFLSLLKQEQLKKAHFPLGAKTKAEIRLEAKRRGLPVADQEESQEICFIPDGDYRRFLESRLGGSIGTPGDIVDLQGNRLGRHQGLYSYTIGQRRGLRLPGPRPHYVLALDPATNRLIAGFEEELRRSELIVSAVNWIPFPELKKPVEAWVQIRYRHKAGPAVIFPLEGDRVRVRFQDPQRSVTPGQAAVFYQGDRVLGGGWIEKAL